MTRFHRETKKKKQFEFLWANFGEKIMGVRGLKSKIEEKFCKVPHGELTAKKWLDSIQKQKSSNLKFVTDGHTDRQSQRQKIIDS